MKELKTLKPFTRFCMTIGELPSSYLISMTYEEQLLWLCNFIKETVIPSVNANSEAITELQTLFNELQEYVNHYFDNLDVQEEINNKLDEMVLDGTLAEILANYLNLSRFIDTTTNLINETDVTKVKAGYIIETFGYSEIEDGGATKILIVDEEPQNKFYFTLQNSLYGIPLTNKENVLIYGVKGDGTTDNTTLLNSIKDYTDKLYFPKGTYLINKIKIENKENYKIYGDGFNSIIKCNNPNTANSFTFIDLIGGTFKVHDIFIDGNYIGRNTPLSFVNTNDSYVKNSKVKGGTSQRTINIQTFDENYGYNNTIENNVVLKDSEYCSDGALIECTGELSLNVNSFLHNLRILNNKCICTSTIYNGNIDLFDCIETDNCYDTIISGNYCENSMHHGISLDTRNINTICTNNICISTSELSTGQKNGIEITGTNGAELMNGIVSYNIIRNFASNGISLNARNYTLVGNKIDNSNRGIILLGEFANQGDIISENICTNITDYGIYCDGLVAGARILNNNASLYLGLGTGGQNFIQTLNFGNNINIKDGLGRIAFLNGIFHSDNTAGINNVGYALDLLTDGRLIFRNPTSNTWQSISKTDI